MLPRRAFKRTKLAQNIGLILLVNFQPAFADNSVISSTATDAATTDTLIITATKQPVLLDKVNSSVLVKTAAELSRAGVSEVADLEKVFAGLVIQTRGNRTYASTSVRGINSPDFYSPTINVLVDGVKQDSAFITQQLINVDRVEFLRGPQGSLYGSNAQGGIINIITKREGAKSSVGMSISNLNRQLEGLLSVDLNDELSADIALRGEQDEGFIKHQSSGKDDANSSRSFSGSLKLHYEQEAGPWDATLALSTDSLDSHEEWYLTEQEFADKATAQDIPELNRNVESVGLTVNYAGEHQEAISISSLQNRRVDREYVGGLWNEDQKTLSQELRLVTQHNEALTSLVGLYLENSKFDGSAFGADNEIEVTTQALFGNLSYAFNDQFDLSLGGRFTHVSSSSDYSGNQAFGIASYKEKRTDELFSPKISLGWQVNEDSRMYLSLTNGYRPGGFNRVPFGNNSSGYDSEKSLSAEWGWRTSMLDDRLNISGALYHIKTGDVQLYTGNIPNQVLSNFGEATSRGIELDVNWRASEQLTFNVGGTLGKSEFDGGNNGLQGNTLTYSPDKTATLGVDYQMRGGDIVLNANARYNSKIYYNEQNSVSQSSVTLLDVASKYRQGAASYRFFINNVTGKEYVSYAYQGMSGIASNYGKGREIGISMNLEW